MSVVTCPSNMKSQTHDPVQSPQAVTVLDPTALTRLAKLHDVDSARLSTLTVPATAISLYRDILAYVAMHQATSAEEGTITPVRTSCTQPFRVQTLRNYDKSLNNLTGAFKARLNTDFGKVKGRVISGIPDISFGLGDAVVVWPPPPNISVEVITSAQKEVDKSHVDATHFSLAFDSLMSDPAAFDKQVEETINANESLENGAASSSSTILVTNYSVGEPTTDRYQSSPMFSEVLLASVDGLPALYNFLKGVVLWRTALNKVPSADGGAFEMLRFVKDHGMGHWRPDGIKPSRAAASVVLPPGRMKDILDDARDFYAKDTKSWYKAHGIPQRRSYLFYGPPGTGKTSTISVLASSLQLACHFLQVSDCSFSNQDLADALRGISKTALLVLEDVDTLFNEDRVNMSNSSMTFSGLLNTLDGLISAEGILTILTTNHADKIEEALLRGGRVDRSFLFEKPDRRGVATYFRSFYEDADQELVNKFVSIVCYRTEGDDARNISTLQQLFITHRRSSAEMCVEATDAFLDSYFERKRLVSKTLPYHV